MVLHSLLTTFNQIPSNRENPRGRVKAERGKADNVRVRVALAIPNNLARWETNKGEWGVQTN